MCTLQNTFFQSFLKSGIYWNKHTKLHFWGKKYPFQSEETLGLFYLQMWHKTFLNVPLQNNQITLPHCASARIVLLFYKVEVVLCFQFILKNSLLKSLEYITSCHQLWEPNCSIFKRILQWICSYNNINIKTITIKIKNFISRNSKLTPNHSF